MDAQARNELAAEFGRIASRAGAFIMSVYAGKPVVRTKADGSPVSEADIGAERLIRAELARLLPGVVMLGEESFDPTRPTAMLERFLLVDPLDGTREFVNRNGEFTVNIALVDAGQPIVGCVYAPAREEIYLAGAHAFRAKLTPGDRPPALSGLGALATCAYRENGLRAVASRSHLDSKTQTVLERLNVRSRRQAGSSLKFCVVAQGDADIYPRLSPTMEWDTAAGQAVLTAAGGCVVGRDGAPLRYGKSDTGFSNDGFIAWGREPLLAGIA
jgi:3'(2'), 5'-bisphosphate nucleotidase